MQKMQATCINEQVKAILGEGVMYDDTTNRVVYLDIIQHKLHMFDVASKMCKVFGMW